MTKPILEKEYIFTQDDFDFFAALSGDFNPIHVDEIFAANSGFGKTVAHGIFLYSIMYENLSGIIDGKIHTSKIQFPAPTFTDTPLILCIDEIANGEYNIEFREKETGAQTCIVSAYLHAKKIEIAAPNSAQQEIRLEKLSIGDSYSTKRIFNQKDIDEYCQKFSSNPNGSVPPPLLNAVISKILGIDLPGLGTNYLKQETEYLAHAQIGEELEFGVKIVKLRPEKKLVDLETICINSGGKKIMSGRALVSVRDVKNAF